MKHSYPIDPILTGLRSFVAKSQGRRTLRVPQSGTGDLSPFQLEILSAEGRVVGTLTACRMTMTLDGPIWFAKKLSHVRENAERLGFEVDIVGEKPVVAREVRRHTPAPPEPQRRNRWEIRTRLLEARHRLAQEVLDGKRDDLLP